LHCDRGTSWLRLRYASAPLAPARLALWAVYGVASRRSQRLGFDMGLFAPEREQEEERMGGYRSAKRSQWFFGVYQLGSDSVAMGCVGGRGEKVIGFVWLRSPQKWLRSGGEGEKSYEKEEGSGRND